MRALIQRVSRAAVRVEGREIAGIRDGLLVFLGVEAADDETDAEWLTAKISRLRIFGDETGKMNLSLADTGGEALVISQFTLHAATRKGNRPSFIRAAAPAHSEPLYEKFCALLEKELGKRIGRGRFGADMKVESINDGPVTIWIDSRARE